VTDIKGGTVVEATEVKLPDRTVISVDSDGSTWRIEQTDRSAITVLDSADRSVATVRDGEVILTTGEVFSWKRVSLPHTRYRLGSDLWVARGSWRSGRRFNAVLSEAMLCREDKALLVGLASILTQHAVAHRHRLWGAVAGV
jgi:hypothetical protein